MKKYLELDDWTIHGALKCGKGGEHGRIILTRIPYKCKKEWDSELSKRDMAKVTQDLQTVAGFLDTGAVTKWYKLDKDITIFDESTKRSYPLSYKSKLIAVMPGLPKTIRLFISQEGEDGKYEFEQQKKNNH